MKEIKFRVWDTNVKAMFSWKQILLRWNSFSILTCPYFIPMQYTGVKDKNNKETYEGDIVTARAFKYLLIVEWDSGECGYVLKSSCTGATYSLSWDFEIKGNIYENPELLKEADNGNKQ